MASEEAFQRAVIDLAHLHCWRVAHFRKVRVQRRDGTVYWETPVAADGTGFPDLEFVRDWMFKAELKFGLNGPTPEQRAWLAAYERAGVTAFLWWPADWGRIAAILTAPVGSPPPPSPSGRVST